VRSRGVRIAQGAIATVAVVAVVAVVACVAVIAGAAIGACARPRAPVRESPPEREPPLERGEVAGFHRWLEDPSRRAYGAPIPLPVSAVCGELRLARAALDAVARAQLLPADRRAGAFARLEREHGLPPGTGAILDGYYTSILRDEYGFQSVSVIYGDERSEAAQPTLVGSIRSADGRKDYQVRWREGVFSKDAERDLPPAKPRPDGYAAELTPPAIRRPEGATIEGVLVDDGAYTLWVDGHELPNVKLAAKLLPANTRTEVVHVNSPRSCEFVDASGHRLAGQMFWPHDLTGAAIGPSPTSPVGLSQHAHLVRVTLDGSAIVTAVERIDSLDLPRVIADARARFERRLAAEEGAIAAKVAASELAQQTNAADERRRRTGIANGPPVSERSPLRRDTEIRYHWRSDVARLELVFVHARVAMWTEVYSMPAPPDACRGGAACNDRPRSQPEYLDFGYGAELATVFAYDANGQLVDTRALPIRERRRF
jgi:hypothetical protein